MAPAGITGSTAEGRSLKTEERESDPTCRGRVRAGRAPRPRKGARPERDVGGGPASAGLPVKPTSQCSTG
jgi:hypothetical protein